MGNCQCLHERDTHDQNVVYSHKTRYRDDESIHSLRLNYNQKEAEQMETQHFVKSHVYVNTEEQVKVKGNAKEEGIEEQTIRPVQAEARQNTNNNVKRDDDVTITTNNFDFDEHNKTIFNIFNEIQANPNHFVKKINEFISDLNEKNNIPKEIQKYFEKKTHLEQLIKVRDYLKDLENLDITLWSQRILMALTLYYSQDDSIGFKADLSETINNQLNKIYIVDEFSVSGLFDPEVMVMKMLIENYDKLDILFSNVYKEGCAISNWSTHPNKARTSLFFFRFPSFTNNSVNSLRKSLLKQITIEDVAKNLSYKAKIVSGSYETDGITINATFELNNGKMETETFDFNKI